MTKAQPGPVRRMTGPGMPDKSLFAKLFAAICNACMHACNVQPFSQDLHHDHLPIQYERHMFHGSVSRFARNAWAPAIINFALSATI